MPVGQPDVEDDEENTPKTRSYVDALLRGNLSPDELARLRGEIGARAEALTVDDDTRTAVRSYVPPADLDIDADSNRTVVRSYIPPDDVDADSNRTVVRSYVPPADLEAEIDIDSNRTVVRSYLPPEDSGVVEIGTFDRGSYQAVGGEPDVDDDCAVVYATEIVDLGDLGDLGDFGPLGAEGGTSGDTPESLLEQTYLVTLGGLASVPRLAMAPGRVTELSLGQKEAFVLSCVDGGSSIEDILDISSLPRLATLRMLYDLLQQAVIDVGRPSRPG